MVKKCLFCGRFFNPDPRVKNQKACFREQCKKARQRLAFSEWCKKNPDHWKHYYQDYVKEWRKRRRKKRLKKQKQTVQNKPQSKISVFKLILLVPTNIRNKMIQNEIYFKRVGRTTFFAYDYDRYSNDTKRDTPENTSNDAGLQMMGTLNDR